MNCSLLEKVMTNMEWKGIYTGRPRPHFWMNEGRNFRLFSGSRGRTVAGNPGQSGQIRSTNDAE